MTGAIILTTAVMDRMRKDAVSNWKARPCDNIWSIILCLVHPTCAPDEFVCKYQRCLPEYAVCNQRDDCRDGEASDELDCPPSECRDGYVSVALSNCGAFLYCQSRLSHYWELHSISFTEVFCESRYLKTKWRKAILTVPSRTSRQSDRV